MGILHHRDLLILKFLIQQESAVLLSSNNGSVFDRGYARVVGATATPGSAQEISRRLRRNPARVNSMPAHEQDLRIDHPVQYCQNTAEHEQEVKNQIRVCLRADSNAPLLITTRDAKALEERKLWVEAVLNEDEFRQLGISLQVLNGEQTSEQEQDIVKKGGSAKTITLATSLAGRGFDLILKQEPENGAGLRQLITDPPANQRQEDQFKGRAARQGKPGSSYRIINREALVTKNGQKVDTLEAFYEANEALGAKKLSCKNSQCA